MYLTGLVEVFAVHRKNLAAVRTLGALQGADDGFLERGVLVWRRMSSSFCELGQDCKRALFIVQGDCTNMRAEDIQVSNLLDIVTSSNGDGGTFDELISGVRLAEV